MSRIAESSQVKVAVFDSAGFPMFSHEGRLSHTQVQKLQKSLLRDVFPKPHLSSRKEPKAASRSTAGG